MNPGINHPEAAVVTAIAEAQFEPHGGALAASQTGNIRPHDFRTASIIPPRELRGLRIQQGEFASTLASRLSFFLRMAASARLAGLQTVTYQKLAQSWANPTHLTLFKLEPLRGVGVLEIPPALGSAMVNRLMGGAGTPSDDGLEIGEIEKALLEQTAQLVLKEWCGHWRSVKELKPTVLGQETNGRHVQTGSPETIMLVVSIEIDMGSIRENLQISLPCAALEPIIRQLSRGAEMTADLVSPSPAKPVDLKWNTCFDDLCVPVNALWDGLEMSARDLLGLKVGDVLRLDPKNTGSVSVRVADQPRFNGRPGTMAGKWAVELTRAVTH